MREESTVMRATLGTGLVSLIVAASIAIAAANLHPESDPSLTLPASAPDPSPSPSPSDRPAAVSPGLGAAPPSDAIVLFDGDDLAEWRGPDGAAPTWTVANGVLTVGKGNLTTRRSFGDIQLHLEWRIPEDAAGEGEARGNSGIKLHEAYEIQIIDSYGESSAKADRQAGSVYAQTAPLVNACRAPGEWQSYDIIFRAPWHRADGELLRHGVVTVFHNGVLVQDHTKILGRTNSNAPVRPDYEQPFFLQDHGSPVAYRNLWVRKLERVPLE
jgi:hypothetical protein